ncbi:DNA translocase FtsK [Psychrobacillus sp. FSL K6-2843]|uniref:DNA translocase FtsK n=1 Tax=Psychrobacillus sp. FSL K6-2843 TaxID=2921549 RepID=UPI00315A67D4
MNWFKKLFSNNEEENIEEFEAEELSPKETKTPFRFPLISDNEKNEFLYGVKEEKIINEPIVNEKKVYEAPPIYEGWQQRKIQPVVKKVEKEIVEEAAIVKKKRPFTPTQVPSPVYGYNKPKEKYGATHKEPIIEREPIISKEKIVSPFPMPQEVKAEQSVEIKENAIEDPVLVVSEETSEVLDKAPNINTSLEESPNEIVEVKQELEQISKVEKPKLEHVEVKEESQVAEPLEVVEESVVNNLEVKEEQPMVTELLKVEEQPLVEQFERKEEQMVIEPLEVKEESVVNVLEVNEEQPMVAELLKVKEQSLFEQLERKEEHEVEEEAVVNALEVNEEQQTVTELLETKETPLVEQLERKEEQQVVESLEVKGESVGEPIKTPEATRTEKIRPFNVLMLKSDKDKLNKLGNKIIPNQQSFSSMPPVSVAEPTQARHKEEVRVEENSVTEPIEEMQEEYTSSYQKPSFSYLLPPEMKDEDKEWMEDQAATLVEALSYFQVSGEIVQMFQGPAVTQFEITVGHGTKVSKIRNLADDLKLALAAKDIRIQAPIPGKSSIGIEIPNRKSRAVRISEVLNTNVFIESDSPLEAALGLDLTGKPVTIDLRKMPHGLIAGATGSGKSVFINSLLVSLLYKATPDELKLLLIDPKMVELAPFNHIPHLVSPVITDVKAATAALKWAVEEMERRYQLFAHIGVRDISRYNTLATEKRQFAQKLPYLVIVIDELADLMMMAPTEVEDAICRIAQKARACGIHLVLATQRPSVDVITGLIKANIPTRIAFSVSSQIDSRTILDQQGAERLLGRGDMLYQGNGMSSPVRIQGTYVTDDEIESVIDYARSQGTPNYMFEQDELIQKTETASEQDELFEEACRFVVEQGSASTSLLQRKFHLGYNRAARLIDAMYESGYISDQRGSKAREVLLTNDSIDQIFS